MVSDFVVLAGGLTIKVLGVVGHLTDKVRDCINDAIWILHDCRPCLSCEAECRGSDFRGLDPRLCNECWAEGYYVSGDTVYKKRTGDRGQGQK